MKAYLFCMLVVLLPLQIPIAKAQKSGHRSAMYQSWIKTLDGSSRINGILYAVGDSSIYVSDALSRRKYEIGDFQILRIEYSQIDRIQVRHVNSLTAGILTGGIVVGGGTFFLLRSNFGDYSDPYVDAFLIILSIPPALAGGAVGGMVGSIKTSFRVHGNYQDFALNRDRLNSYAFVKDTVGIGMLPREKLLVEKPYCLEKEPQTDKKYEPVEKQLADDPLCQEIESHAIKEEEPSSSGFFVAYSMGPVIPVADFADTRALNPKSGFAGVGIGRNLQVGYDTQYNFLLALQGSYNEYNLNRRRIKKWIDAQKELYTEQEFTDFTNMMWRIFNLSAALSYGIPLNEKWLADLQLQLGYAYSWFRGDTYLFQYGQGPSYGFHTVFRYNRTPQWSFLIDAGYFISTQKMKYQNIQPGIKTRELQGFNLQAGMMYRF
jgi:hypothetical protein